jgi:LPPG:FO 2-phospho-L-lactate transferase
MYLELGIEPSAHSVARHYRDLLSGFVMDELDEALVEDVQALGIRTLVTNTLMKTPGDRRRLAEAVLKFYESCQSKGEY